VILRIIYTIRSPEVLTKALFSDEDPQISYQRLTENLHYELHQLINSLSDDVRRLYEDIQYCQNVSKDHFVFDWVQAEELNKVLTSLEKMKKEAQSIEIDSNYNTKDCPLTAFLDQYTNLKEVYRVVLRSFREIKSVKPSLNQLEENVLTIISSEGTSLKGLFLELYQRNIDLATEELFNVLKDLFEKTQVAITVKREK